MLKKSVEHLLVCAAVLLAAAPSKAFAQTASGPGPAVAAARQSYGDAPARPGLRATFAEVTAKARADAGPDVKRLERGWLTQTAANPQTGLTKREKVLIVALVVVIVGLAIVIAHNTGKGDSVCDVDPFAPECVGTQ